jgi:hypothetical protein
MFRGELSTPFLSDHDIGVWVTVFDARDSNNRVALMLMDREAGLVVDFVCTGERVGKLRSFPNLTCYFNYIARVHLVKDVSELFVVGTTAAAI